MTNSAAHQTISYLSRRFSEAGLRLNARHGQNFLVDLNLLKLLARKAQLTEDDVVLEVGTGTGALTALMAADAAEVITAEIDPRLFQLASEELFGLPNVQMFNLDALLNKSHLNPQLLDAVQAHMNAPYRQFKLVANLPYSIATPVIANLLSAPIVPRTMTVTIQKELAERITAHPGTKAYGGLSVWIQSQCQVELVRILPPGVFWPRPKVTSAIVHIVVDDALRGRIPDLARFHDFLRGLFIHRRKYLRVALENVLFKKIDKSRVDAFLAARGLPPHTRAEQLDIEQILALFSDVDQMRD
jgi:16S rRNA (adenine1518-N6/adenine1519-N6)-dimethyltransferase